MRRASHLLLAAPACFSLQRHAVAADPGRSIIPGIVTRPLDDIVEYQALARLGIGRPLASQFAPAVLELGAAGFDLERSTLARVLD